MNAIPADDFTHDFFFSHSSKDKAVVRVSTLSASNGERIPSNCRRRRKETLISTIKSSLSLLTSSPTDRLRVWLDDWEIRPGDLSQEIRSSRRESSQTSTLPKQSMSGLTSAATREEMIEKGLEHSRVLACPAEAPGRRRMLCMSANAFGSDWAQLESHTFRFRDPLSKDRRFIPLRLDDTHQRLLETIPLHQLGTTDLPPLVPPP